MNHNSFKFSSEIKKIESLLKVPDGDDGVVVLSAINSYLSGPFDDSIPGKRYAYSREDISREDLDSLFTVILNNNNTKANLLCVELASQIAAYDFPYFVSKLSPPLFDQKKKETHQFTASISRHILDPTYGFLAHAPLSCKNNVWGNKPHIFIFFGVETSDLKTPFGLALSQFREEMNNLISFYFMEYSKEQATGYDFITLFTPSFLNYIQTTIVPPDFQYQKLACGFSMRAQILLTFSRLQEMSFFSKKKSYNFNEAPEACRKWIEILDDEGAPDLDNDKNMFQFHHPMNIKCDVKFRLLKLLVFLNPTALKKQQVIDKFLINGIFGPDKVMAGFMIFFFQAVVFIYPKFSFSLLDAIFAKIDNLIIYTTAQNSTLLHCLTRYVDILGCLPERYLDCSQIAKANAFAIIGFTSSNPYVRHAAQKLLNVLGAYETDDKNLCLSRFMQKNKRQLEQDLLKFFTEDPRIKFNESHKILLPISFEDALKTRESTIWTNILRLIALIANKEWPDIIKASVVQFTLFFIENQTKTELEKNNIYTIINMLTLISAFDKEYFPGSFEKIVHYSVYFVLKYAASHYSHICVMLGAVHSRFYQPYLEQIKFCKNVTVLSLSIRVFAQNQDFAIIVNDEALLNLFIDIIDQIGLNSFNSDLHLQTSKNYIDPFPDDGYILENFKSFVDLLHSGTSINHLIFEKYKVCNITPFPCWECVLATDKPECNRLKYTFLFIFQAAKAETDDSNRVLHYWSLKCLNSFCSAIAIDDPQLLFNNTFNDYLKELSNEEPDLIANILSHQFILLFGRFVQLALMPDGAPYFLAICKFFTAPWKNRRVTSIIKDILMNQWSSVVDVDSNSPFTEYLQVIYENSGSLIFLCFLYLTTSFADEAFILLASIAPIIIMTHNKGRAEDLEPVFRVFISISTQFMQSIAGIDTISLRDLSSKLCDHLKFCMEQIFYDAFTYLNLYTLEVFNEIVPILSPWFASVKFDLDNRVISSHSDLLFMQFSCISFVEHLISSFSPFSGESINSSIFAIWRLLLKSENNFQIILKIIIIEATMIKNHNQLFFIIRYLFKVRPKETMHKLCNILSYSFLFHDIPKIESVSHIVISNLNDSEEGSEASTDSSLFGSLPYPTLTSFVLFCLSRLISDAISPILPHLPKIIAFCLVFLDQHFSLILRVFLTLLNKLEGLYDDETTNLVNDLIRIISILPNYYESFSSKTLKQVYKRETEYNKSIPETNRIELSKRMNVLLKKIKPKMSQEFGMELLAWGLCCTDMFRATMAIRCFRGVAKPVDGFILSLFARALWNASEAAHFLTVESRVDVQFIILYITAMIDTYIAIFDQLNNDTSVFWIAVSCLQCNISEFHTVFNSSLELLELFLQNTNLLAFISQRSSYKAGMWTPASFKKYRMPNFNGCLHSILGYSGKGCNIERMIRILNILVQNRYSPLLITDSTHCLYICIICLLPWMWSVILTDMTRYMFDSPRVQLMDQTVEALSETIENEKVMELIMKLFQSDENDIYSVMEDICQIIVPFLDIKETALISNFFTNLLLFGDRFTVIPVYSMATSVCTFAKDRSATASAFEKFTVIVKSDKKDSRKYYRMIYLESVIHSENVVKQQLAQAGKGKTKTSKIENNLDFKNNALKNDVLKNDEFKKDALKKDALKKDALKKDALKKDELKKDELKKDELKKDELKDNELKNNALKNDPSYEAYSSDDQRNNMVNFEDRPQLLVELTDQEYQDFLVTLQSTIKLKDIWNYPIFPELHVFEQIVAVNIPQYYVFTSNESEIDFNDPKKFPPLLPNYSHLLLKNERFVNINKQIREIVYKGKRKDAEIFEKLKPSIVDEDTVKVLKSRGEGLFTNTQTIFKRVIDMMMLEDIGKLNAATEKMEKTSKNFEDDKILSFLVGSSPMDLIVIPSNVFLPTDKEICCVVKEAFTNNTDEEMIV